MRSRWLLAASLVTSLTSSAFAGTTASARAPMRTEMDFYQPSAVVTRSAVRAKLMTARADNVARFRTYQAAKVFPSNTFSDAQLNVWRDAENHLCAAATMISLSGAQDLAQRTGDLTNNIRLADVTEGPLMTWILTSGLTQDEIAAIQRPFMPVQRPDKPTIIDAKLRAAETKRLVAKYKKIDAAIAKATRASLEKATDRLMANPELASAFLRDEHASQYRIAPDRAVVTGFAQPPPG